jgi:hypothetical protein
MINETIELTQEQLLQAHSVVTIPSLLILYITMSLIFLIIGLIVGIIIAYKKKSTPLGYVGSSVLFLFMGGILGLVGSTIVIKK